MVFRINKKQVGFTIIELIVVIAIIAVLAAIVIVNVTQYINKSKISAIKATMTSFRIAAVQFYSNGGDDTQTNICAIPSFGPIIDNMNATYQAGDYGCSDLATGNPDCSSGKWAVAKTLPDGKIWCVDYSGVSEYITSLGGGTGCSCDNFAN